MRNILYLVDAEGFGDVSNFIIKEMSVYNVEARDAKLYYFKIGKRSKLSKRELGLANYLKRNTHGLRYEDESADLDQSQVQSILTEVCSEAAKKNKFIAYKGRAHIDKLVKSLGYEEIAVNLEDLECPRFIDIVKSHRWIYDKCVIHRCPRHYILDNGHYGQCSRMKAFVYIEYLDHLTRIRLSNRNYPTHNPHRTDS